jgi:NADH-quinone oxidoreductase subunit K
MEDGKWRHTRAVSAILHSPFSILAVKNMNVGLEQYLVVSFLLFALGLLGVVMRRNLLVIYMSLELMLNAANLALVSFSRFNNQLDGQVLVFFIITVAAAEVSVGLALIVALYRKRQSAHVEDLTTMKL